MTWISDQKFDDKQLQQDLLDKGKIPAHVACIMDGNGRWAVGKGLKRHNGHREGIESVRDIVKAASQLGVKYLTLYAFSIENWNRPASEVGVLMNLLEQYLRRELKELHENKVRVKAIGKLSSLPKVVQKLLHESVETTKNNTGLTLTLALSYSGRWDIVRAVQMISLDVRRGKVSPEDISNETFTSYLQTAGTPDPDLLIRTSGELRLSNFLLWEMAYGEMYVTETYWPKFRRNEFYTALESYMTRERRFGKTSAQISGANQTQTKKKDSYIKRVVNAFKSK